MLKLIRSLLAVPEPLGPSQRLRAYSERDRPITQTDVVADQGGWCIDVRSKGSIPLFELADLAAEQSLLAYRAELKTANLKGKAYLEMWCRFPGQGEFFSRDLAHTVSGTRDWSRHEAPFYLKKGQRPDLLKLNLAVEGTGKVWIRNIEVLRTPLSR
jgi:hypothetical protein